MIGNGSIAIAFDDKMNVRDFFYPRVGLKKHLNGHFLWMGFWVDGAFRWSDDGWDVETGYMPETLVEPLPGKALRPENRAGNQRGRAEFSFLLF